MIARSLIIGSGIPILVGVLLAAVVGTGLSAFLLTLLGKPGNRNGSPSVCTRQPPCSPSSSAPWALLPLVSRLTRLDAIRTG